MVPLLFYFYLFFGGVGGWVGSPFDWLKLESKTGWFIILFFGGVALCLVFEGTPKGV